MAARDRDRALTGWGERVRPWSRTSGTGWRLSGGTVSVLIFAGWLPAFHCCVLPARSRLGRGAEPKPRGVLNVIVHGPARPVPDKCRPLGRCGKELNHDFTAGTCRSSAQRNPQMTATTKPAIAPIVHGPNAKRFDCSSAPNESATRRSAARSSSTSPRTRGPSRSHEAGRASSATVLVDLTSWSSSEL